MLAAMSAVRAGTAASAFSAIGMAGAAIGTADAFFAALFCFDDICGSAADDQHDHGTGDDAFDEHDRLLSVF